MLLGNYQDVGSGHEVYWELWGSQEGTPIIALHGGPGSGCGDSFKDLFDREKHNVLFHDQRGSGNSLPFASTRHNTTQDLLGDIEKIRTISGIDKAHIVGGSWGSTLGLLYALENPDRVDSLLLWSTYLGTRFENDWVNEGYPKQHFPLEWERFISVVPSEYRGSGTEIMAYYRRQINSDCEEVANKYAVEWTLWESVLSTLEYKPKEMEEEIREDPRTTAVARLETHYFSNGCFIPEGYILDRIAEIGHIPCKIFHGRFDMCTPASTAVKLSSAYGPNCEIEWVNSGHSRNDQQMKDTLRGAILNL